MDNLNIETLQKQIEHEIGFAEQGTKWREFLYDLKELVDYWLDLPVKERFA